MQFKIFKIDVAGDQLVEEELNHFLRSHRIVTVHRELARTSSGTQWCFCVEYLDNRVNTPSTSTFSSKKDRVDYKEVLSDTDFAVFSKIRDLRKDIATQETIPVYNVCTNDHLAQMVLNRCTTLSSLQKISGFGDAKMKKYGARFIEMLVPLIAELSTTEVSPPDF